MERIDLLDKYIFGELSSEERKEVEYRLDTDDEFSSEFEIYKLCVRGIRKEVEQDNFDFLQAMKGISKQGLNRAIGREITSISREQLLEQLRGKLQSRTKTDESLSGIAALSAGSTDDDELEIAKEETENEVVNLSVDHPKKDNFKQITTVFIIVLLLALILSLFI